MKTLIDCLVDTARAMLALVHRAHAHLGNRRSRAATYRSLKQLDNRVLHDLGLDRSEILSVAAEACGDAADTRIISRPAEHPKQPHRDRRNRLHLYVRG